jgi:hypothetical protein
LRPAPAAPPFSRRPSADELQRRRSALARQAELVREIE